jgi:hypothetical protein
MSESAEPVLHLPLKVKNNLAVAICGKSVPEDMIRDDPADATCKECVDTYTRQRDDWNRAEEERDAFNLGE